MDDTPLTIKGPDIVEQLLRPHDVFLADAFLEFEYSTEDQLTLQDCRMHLGVSSLAQITTACGSRITLEAWKGQKLTTVHKTKGIQTYRPVAKHWELWRSALTKAFLHPNLERLPLRRQLGLWYTGSDPRWIWWKHQPSNTLFEQRQSGEWFCWSFARVWHHHRKYNNPTLTESDTIPTNMHRASITQSPLSPYVTVLTTQMSAAHIIPPPVTTIDAAIKALPESARWAPKHILLMDQGEQLATALQQRTAVAVSDGSLKLGLGTAGFVIEGHNGCGRIQGVNKVPGPVKDGDSHWCEVSGLYAIILLVNAICKLHNVPSGSITIACDNITSLNIFNPDYFPNTNQANFDLVSAFWTLL